MTDAAERNPAHAVIALALAVLMAGVVGTALAFEHVGGYIPCALCLAEREPYYAAIPLALLAALAAGLGWPSALTRGLLALVGLLMAYGLVLGVYHAGVEWKIWPGPAECGAAAAAISETVDDLLADLSRTRPPSCDSAAGRFMGLSFAGWNVVASAGLMALAGFGAAMRGRGTARSARARRRYGNVRLG